MTKKQILDAIALDRHGKPFAEIRESVHIIQVLDEALTNQIARAEQNGRVNIELLHQLELGAISAEEAERKMG